MHTEPKEKLTKIPALTSTLTPTNKVKNIQKHFTQLFLKKLECISWNSPKRSDQNGASFKPGIFLAKLHKTKQDGNNSTIHTTKPQKLSALLHRFSTKKENNLLRITMSTAALDAAPANYNNKVLVFRLPPHHDHGYRSPTGRQQDFYPAGARRYFSPEIKFNYQ